MMSYFEYSKFRDFLYELREEEDPATEEERREQYFETIVQGRDLKDLHKYDYLLEEE